MASSIRTRLTIDVAGQPIQWSQPFVQTFLTLAQAPAQYDVTIDADSSAVIWDGTPLGVTFDFIALQSDRDCHVEFVVNGGQVDEYHFTLFLRGGGFPIVVPGGQSYAGQAGTQSAFTFGTLREITKVNALNPDVDFPAVVSALVAQTA